MRKITLAAAALLALSTVGASAQSGLSTQDPHKGAAQEGGRTQATPGYTPDSGMTPGDKASQPTPRSGLSTQDSHSGPAQAGGRTQATPGASGSGSTMDTTGTVTPRSGVSTQDPHKGPAQEGGRTQATPGPTR
ncbi:hypothetical protein GCM10007301_09090 [Azorhizobium oxalatiphilum]|uniref:Uncharacterized protein n=1 Tax=Azorhizobium oxalatiphilum TaxID=980631 RepID=A0A917BNM2_9HYPH|nr:hypothetical protein [Azorhizobium oxalatiphilum]GGF51836.1 hypothetical protein GCM10007301_09090 [Azorhizobium oxalatiphilum]